MCKKILLAGLLSSFLGSGYAQINEPEPLDTLTNFVQRLNSSVELLKQLRISGYLQAQYQLADTFGISSFAGGEFPKNSNDRFMVRRGRVKFAHEGVNSKLVAQFDITEKGMGVKDAYLSVTDPKFMAFHFTGGLFNKPFGFEVSYSSGMRESPERSRVVQTLFPGERDLGGMVTFNPPKTSRWNYIKIDAGLFAGNGPNPEFDTRKDISGRIGLSRSNIIETVKYGGGVSYYLGGVYQGTKHAYRMGAGSRFTRVESDSTIGRFIERQYFGIDAQLTLEWPLGLTTIRGEYITGQQPGSDISTVSPTRTLPNFDTYIRNFHGYNIYLTHGISGTRHSLVVKYDVYDPNLRVSADGIGATVTGLTKATTAADVRFATIGFGWTYAITSNVKATLYYDIVRNETSSNLAGFAKDINDNVLTIRFQYKFYEI